jgi:hypothetical protein
MLKQNIIVLCSAKLCCDVRYDFRIKLCSVRVYLQLFVRGLLSYLRYLCLFAYSGVQHILCCVFVPLYLLGGLVSYLC